MDFFDGFLKSQKELQEKAQLRSLKIFSSLDFCSNDYLGFSENTELKAQFAASIKNYPLGSTGSRLIRGQNRAFVDLEKNLAARSSSEDALVFPTGYLANLGLFASLSKTDGIIFSDALIHASIIDGIRLSGCEKQIFNHNDPMDLESRLSKAPVGQIKFVVVESIYSMMGDFAPLDKLLAVCQKYQAHLIVDEAHGTGLYGSRGMGVTEALGLRARVFACIHTAGKALGVSGAWVSGSKALIDHMVNFSRPFIYSTGMSYPQLLLIKAALEFWDRDGEDQAKKALERVEGLRSALVHDLKGTPFFIHSQKGPVISLHIGSNEKTMAFSSALEKSGYNVKGIRPPTVPPGHGLLRITVPGGRTPQQIQGLQLAILQAAERLSQ